MSGLRVTLRRSSIAALRRAIAIAALGGLPLIGGSAISQEMNEKQYRCMQLEQNLANDWAADERGAQDELPRIEGQIREFDRTLRRGEAEMESGGCYESFFIFGRGLVRSPRCLKMNARVEDARRQLDRLQQQREALRRSGGGRSKQDRIMEALARYGCGDQYQREANRRRGGGGFFDWLEGNGEDRGPDRNLETSRIVPYGTYRTICVRACDGYYYPVNYSAVPNQFSADASQCQSQCAAPAELYVYRNPGEEVQQAVSLSGKAYSQLPNAFKYRKEFVKGCSCKQAEYVPPDAEGDTKKSEADPAHKQADASSADDAPKTEGPTAQQ